MEVISRSGWGAREPKSRSAMVTNRRDRIFLHWPAQPKGLSDKEHLMRAQNYHMDSNGWSDIGYSFAVGRTGKGYELRGFNVQGSHTKGENSDSYGILALIGVGEKIPQALLDGISEMIEYIRVNDPLFGEREDVVVMGHRHDKGASTTCPGDELADWIWKYKHSRDYKPKTVTPAPAPTVPSPDAPPMPPAEPGFSDLEKLFLKVSPYDVINAMYLHYLGRTGGKDEIGEWLQSTTGWDYDVIQGIDWSIKNSSEAQK